MTYAGELMIWFLANSSACSILLTVLHLALVYLPRNAEMLIACQSLCRKSEGDSIPEQEREGDASALHFLDNGVGL